MAAFGGRSYAANAESEIENVDDFKCKICLEILTEPQILPCSHKFCQQCLSMTMKSMAYGSSGQCPYCRQHYPPSSVKPAMEARRKIQNFSVKCKTCGEKIRLIRMRNHEEACTVVGSAKGRMAMGKASNMSRNGNTRYAFDAGVEGVAGYNGNASGRQPQNQINNIKQTFDCPCCSVQRLGRESLLEHVKTQHRNLSSQVVCPICAAMPWGDPEQKSQDFIQHIQLRHKFDYEYYVDFNEDEDEVLKKTLTKSMYHT